MDKLAHILVARHKAIFIVAMAFAVASACLMPFVTVNKDMTKYIPADMQSKVAMDIMSEEFGDESQFRMMFEGVPAAEQGAMVDRLKALDCVNDVVYDETEPYHNDDCTLYKVTVDGGTYSEKAMDAYGELQEFAETTGYACYFDSEVIDAALPNLALIIAVAVTVLVIILAAMSKSWFDPVLLLATLGVAVIMNAGTNVVFESVSDTTFSIAAVFQMVLSLDYSVMLISRYREERAKTENIPEAMERAIRNAFGSIVSSSLTTVVGLACLVFMSFTIGRDMGLVLAKGVVFSLLCVFAVMPTFVMASDKILARTAKRAFHPAMRRWAVVSAKGRWPILVAFLLIFAGGFALRNNAEASFVLPSLNEDHLVVEERFPKGSQVIVLYHDADEEAVAGLVDAVAAMDGVKDINCYASTLGKRFTAGELARAMDIDPAFITLLYHYREQGGAAQPMTVHDFASFVQSDIAGNPAFASQMRGADLSQVGLLANVIDPAQMTRARTAESMAGYFGDVLNASGVTGFGAAASMLTAENLRQLYLLYYLQSPDAPAVDPGTMSIVEMVDFLENEVLSNEQLASALSEDEASMIREYAPIAKAAIALAEYWEVADYLGLHDQYSPSEIAWLLDVDESLVVQLYRYRVLLNGGASSWTMTPYQLVAFLSSSEAREAIGGQMDDETLRMMGAMRDLMAAEIAGKAYGPSEMAAKLATIAGQFGQASIADGLDETALQLLYLYRGASAAGPSGQTMSIDEFVEFITGDVLTDPLFASFIDRDMRAALEDAKAQIAAGKGKLVGSQWNRMIIDSAFASESEEMIGFLGELRGTLNAALTSEYYLAGEGPMVADMRGGFMDELNFITLLTAAAIFLIVLLTFRNLLIPIVLVALIQSSFFWTMAANGLAGSPMYYVAIIIVQAILMGATIDYAILYTSHYREKRQSHGVRDALVESYRGSTATMLTSGSILVVVTALLGFGMGGTAVGDICLTIAEGSLIALVLVMLVLPGALAALDRFVAGKGRVLSE